MEKINWGIIGCGNVTEVKSGPAFNKVHHSSLVAVMRRDGEKAKDYAARHQVPKWYNDAERLIDDPEVNAIYIATPPSSHESYLLAALKARKPVYIEKPMALNFASAENMARAAALANVKVSIAHYRRGQPYFNRIKQLLDEKAIGVVRVVQLSFLKSILSADELKLPGNSWRVNPSISGGGLFHDLAPHQLDLLYYFFGAFENAHGISRNQTHLYPADDVVAGNIVFNSGVVFNGLWSFNVAEGGERDECEIFGSDGSIRFSVFGAQKIILTRKGKEEIITFSPPHHVQQPMIEKVVDFFLDRGPNPCSPEDGALVMRLMDAFTSHSH